MQAPNIQWMKAVELMKYIADHSEEFASQTLKQAETGFTELANGQFVKNVIETTANDRFMYPATTASAAAAEAGTALAETATSSTANLTLVSSASGTTGIAGIVSLAVPVAASLLAAVGGYLVGNSLYENNQDFFDGITGPLMKYAADGTVNLMGIMDAKGNTYLDKRAYDSVKAFLDSYIPTGTDYIWNDANISKLAPTSSSAFSFVRTAKYQIADNEIVCNGFTPANYIATMDAIGKYLDLNFPGCVTTMISRSTNIDGTFDSRYPQWGAQFQVMVFKTLKSVSFRTRSYSDPYKLVAPSGSTETYYFGVCPSIGDSTNCICISTLPGTMGFSKYDVWVTPKPPVTSTDGGTSIDPSYKYEYSNISTAEQSTLPNGISKYTPKTTSLTNLLLHTTVDGCPTELPFIPVRFPTAPNIIPFPTPDENPSENDPEKKPDLTPFVDPNPPYPDKVPKPQKKPLPTPEQNPDKKPCVLPNPIPNPDPTPDNTPDPSTDPSQQPDPTTDPTPTPTPKDPTTNPDDGGKTPTNNVPVVVPISGSADGLLHVYNPTSDEINQFGAWLWTTFSTNFLDTIAKLFNNPMDAVIGLHELYIKPTDGATKVIKAGFQDSPVSAPVVTKRYEEINCGSIVIQEHWGNYLDYSPYTKVYCYLPFIGIVDLEADDIIAHAINITYRVDTYTGACIAIITVAKEDYNSVTYQFSGNCSVQVPITSGVMTALQNVIIGAATAGIGAMAAKGVTLSRIANAEMAGGIRRGVNSKNEVQHSGSFGANFGAMGIKKPYIIVKRPKQKVVPGYNVNYGYPAHKMVTISECSGYTRVREVDVISVTATEDEKKDIETMLKAGIFVS